jgi:cellulose synthase/poly-beta-1,6-N-acetylglucosamine synthase-like glycosyltransferase
MSVESILAVFNWASLLYLVGITAGYLTLDFIAMAYLHRYMAEHVLDGFPQACTGFEPQISILVPAYNEEATIAASLRSLLQLTYSEYEIIAINDGSDDRTMEVLIDEFQLTPFPETYDRRLATKPLRAVYTSARYPNLRVIDKVNGGKADALNVGINLSRYPLFCCIDADSVLERDSLRRVVQPFLNDARTIASGGTIRIANGCEAKNGFLTRVGLPSNWLALFQLVEYLRAFLFGRVGWSPLNAVLIISGAFGVFHKDTVVSVGGYRRDTIGEDMELIVRMHRVMRLQRKPYRISFVPDPVCWTEAPEDFATLRNQRIRWQRGLCESLSKNIELLCHPHGGTAGWLAFPFMILFEMIGPVVEIFMYVFLIAAFALGYLSLHTWLTLLVLVISLGVLLSISALLLEELSFHLYPNSRQLLVLALAAVAENFGYRQLNSWWKLVGMYRWLGGTKAQWGRMTRKAAWQTQ